MNTFQEIFNNPIYDQTNNMVRWNGLNRIKDETVGHHTHIVTLFTRIILEDIFEDYDDSAHLNSIIADAMTYAVFHDFDESFTGDILHNFKHNNFNGSRIRADLEDYLNNIRIKYFNLQTPLHSMIAKYAFHKKVDDISKNVVKLADWLSMAFYTKKEISLGNTNATEQYQYCLDGAKAKAADLINLLGSVFPGLDLRISVDILRDIQKL